MTPPKTHHLLERIRTDWHRETPELDPSPMLLFLLLARLQGALGRHVEQTYTPAGINPSGWDLLLTLRRSAPDTGLTPTELSNLSAITGASITNRVSRLIEKGLVERRGSETDRRSARIRLTRQGRELVDTLLPQHVQHEASVLEALTPEERAELERLARKLLTHVESAESE